MEFRQLGRSGLQVPVLSLGTATFGGGTEFFKHWGSTDAGGARNLVDIALDAGVVMFDSADVYSAGLAEEVLGAAIAGRRERVLISTKGTFRMGPGPNDIGSSRHRIIAACEAMGAPGKPEEHLEGYGHGYEDRLTGHHETAHYSEFRYGVSDRGASIRIPWQVARDQKGYVEDRRPNANIDPYVVARLVTETVCSAV